MSTGTDALAASIVAACRRLDERGLVAATDGNVSARLGAERMLITPTGLPKHRVTVDRLVVIDFDGNVLDGGRGGRPSSEYRLHAEVYRRRPSAGAVVHAHPPIATGFATAGLDLAHDALPEVVLTLGRVPLAAYGRTGTDDLPASIRPFLHGNDTHAVLLANHGAVTWADDVDRATQRMESVEHVAKILFVARELGGERPLPDDELRALDALRRAML